MRTRKMSFRKSEDSTEFVEFNRTEGADLAEEMARLEKKGLDSKTLVFEYYLDAVDIKVYSKGRGLLKGTKTKPPMLKAEVIRLLTEWEPTLGTPRMTEEQKDERTIEGMSEEKARLFLAKLQVKLKSKK